MSTHTDVYGNAFQYEYDDNGNRKSMKDYNNGRTDYSYDGLNRLTTLGYAGLGTFNWTYNSAGLTEKIDYPNGASVEYLYDDANRIASIRNIKSGADISKHLYTYDSNGNRLTMTESNIHSNQLITYGYDRADRLTSVTYPNNEKTTYQLDKVGNRDKEIITGTTPNTKTYSYNTRDQLIGITDTLGSSTSYTYDDAGNQLTKDTDGLLTTFDYSPRHRVKSITVGAQVPINYQYDYTGQRINYERNGSEKRYLYDGLTLIAETNTIGNTIARYHYGDRYQLAEQRNSVNSYYHVDSLGTNVAVTNQDGSIQARYEYGAFGNLLTQAGSSETPFGFTGYQKDEDTGLYYANARYYDSNTGRFNREDPLQGNIQKPPSLHRYMYAFSNPGSYIDPTGNGNDTAHYYDALFIGKLVGLNEYESYAYALGAQIGDEFKQTDAVENSKAYLATELFVKHPGQSVAETIIFKTSQEANVANNCGNHALCNIAPRYFRAAAKDYIVNGSNDLLEVGTADHAFTDSFFHIARGQIGDTENQMLLTPIQGHVLEWTSTDKAYLYHSSKRVKAFRARAWALYERSVKRGNQTLNRSDFREDLDEAVRELDAQQDRLLKQNTQWEYTKGWFVNYDSIDDKEEFNMVADLLSGKGFSNIPRTEDHDIDFNINGLLNDFSEEQLRGIILSVSTVSNDEKFNSATKPELIKYLNNRLLRAQAKSRDYLHQSIMLEKNKSETVKEDDEGPGIKELSK